MICSKRHFLQIIRNIIFIIKHPSYFLVCGNTLHKFTASPNSSRNPSHTPADAYINSPITWCTNSWDNKYIHVKFKTPVIVGGIVLQGDSTANNWVKKFKVLTSFNKSNKVQYQVTLHSVPTKRSFCYLTGTVKFIFFI